MRHRSAWLDRTQRYSAAIANIPESYSRKRRTLKIIFLNRFFYPDHSATSQMLSDLAFELARKGHNVQVITSRLTYEGDRMLSPQERIANVAVSRVPTTAFGRDKLLGRTLDYFTFYLSAGFRLALDAQRGDVVVVKTDPPMLSVVAGPIARVKGARYHQLAPGPVSRGRDSSWCWQRKDAKMGHFPAPADP